MICPKCGCLLNSNYYCQNCSITYTAQELQALTGLAVSSLEKIESLPMEYNLVTDKKLNEVIEKVNRIIDYLNHGVKK